MYRLCIHSVYVYTEFMYGLLFLHSVATIYTLRTNYAYNSFYILYTYCWYTIYTLCMNIHSKSLSLSLSTQSIEMIMSDCWKYCSPLLSPLCGPKPACTSLLHKHPFLWDRVLPYPLISTLGGFRFYSMMAVVRTKFSWESDCYSFSQDLLPIHVVHKHFLENIFFPSILPTLDVDMYTCESWGCIWSKFRHHIIIIVDISTALWTCYFTFLLVHTPHWQRLLGHSKYHVYHAFLRSETPFTLWEYTESVENNSGKESTGYWQL